MNGSGCVHYCVCVNVDQATNSVAPGSYVGDSAKLMNESEAAHGLCLYVFRCCVTWYG